MLLNIVYVEAWQQVLSVLLLLGLEAEVDLCGGFRFVTRDITKLSLWDFSAIPLVLSHLLPLLICNTPGPP